MPATVELHIRRLPDQSLVADATLTSAASAVASQLTTGAPITFDTELLLALSNDPDAYGAALKAQIFATPALRRAWLQASAYTTESNHVRNRTRLRPCQHQRQDRSPMYTERHKRSTSYTE
jgi:hypothetical protein